MCIEFRVYSLNFELLTRFPLFEKSGITPLIIRIDSVLLVLDKNPHVTHGMHSLTEVCHMPGGGEIRLIARRNRKRMKVKEKLSLCQIDQFLIRAISSF